MKKSLMAFAAAAIITIPFITSAATFSTWLTFGSRGVEVTGLQAVLVAEGYLKVAPSGYFGTLTKKAVIAYQAANGLDQVGSVGPKTRALLNAYVVAHLNTSSVAPSAPISPVAPAAPVTPAPVNNSPLVMPENTPTTSGASSTSSTPPAQAASPNDPPHVTIVAPASVIARTTMQTDMKLTTDKVSSCRFGTQPEMNFSDMTRFNTNDGLMHTYALSNLSVDALYVYYVRCNDMNDRASQEMTLSFSVTGK
jgi:peptidoglycan hydrolase-like protein with peptidoglycan-binding domain